MTRPVPPIPPISPISPISPALPASDVLVRPFRRADRDQLTALVNAHVQAVVPGVTVSVNAVLSALERESGEFVVDPWVVERTTLVAEQRGRVVAAAHLLRYGDDDAVGASYRGIGEIRWLVCWPDAPFWPDAVSAGDAVAAAAVRVLLSQGVRSVHADGALPAPGVFGLPDPWPHVHGILERTGFRAGPRTEVVFLADVAAIPRPTAPLPGLRVSRTLGSSGTRLSGILDGEVLGYVEVELLTGDHGRGARHEGWADVGNLHVSPAWRRQGVGRWLLGEAAGWLALGHVDRLLDYADPDDLDHIGVLVASGFTELTRTRREWDLPL